MPFDVITRTALEYYTAHPPATEDVWYGPWIAILTTLFPSTQGYIVTPQRRLPPPPDDDAESHIPDLVIEVVTLSLRLSTAAPPARPGGLTFRTVLIVKVKKLPALASKPFFNNNGSSIDKLMLRSRALLTQNFTGLARSDLIGGTEKRRTMGKIYVRSLTGSIPLTTKPRLMTFEFLPTWSLRCTYFSFFQRRTQFLMLIHDMQVIRFAHCWNPTGHVTKMALIVGMFQPNPSVQTQLPPPTTGHPPTIVLNLYEYLIFFCLRSYRLNIVLIKILPFSSPICNLVQRA